MIIITKIEISIKEIMITEMVIIDLIVMEMILETTDLLIIMGKILIGSPIIKVIIIKIEEITKIMASTEIINFLKVVIKKTIMVITTIMAMRETSEAISTMHPSLK